MGRYAIARLLRLASLPQISQGNWWFMQLIGANTRRGHHKDCPCMLRTGRRRTYRFRWLRFAVPLALAAGVGLPLAMLIFHSSTTASAGTQAISSPKAALPPHAAAPTAPSATRNLPGRQGSTSNAPSLSPAPTPDRGINVETVPTTMTSPPERLASPLAGPPKASRRTPSPIRSPMSDLLFAAQGTPDSAIPSNPAAQGTPDSATPSKSWPIPPMRWQSHDAGGQPGLTGPGHGSSH